MDKEWTRTNGAKMSMAHLVGQESAEDICEERGIHIKECITSKYGNNGGCDSNDRHRRSMSSFLIFVVPPCGVFPDEHGTHGTEPQALGRIMILLYKCFSRYDRGTLLSQRHIA